MWLTPRPRRGPGQNRPMLKTTAPLSNMYVLKQDRGFMRIAGKWHKCQDGVVRPVLLIRVSVLAGTTVEEPFLVDSGADRTVLSAALLSNLGGSTSSLPAGVMLAGIGGTQGYVEIQVSLNLPR